MRVRTKILAILGSSVVILMGVLGGGSYAVLSRSARIQDLARINDKASRLKAILDSEIRGLDRQIKDTAAWDETYAFVRKPGRGYIESNLVPSAFVNNRYRFLAFFDSRGRFIHASAYDESTGAPASPPAGLVERFRPGGRLWKAAQSDIGVAGVLTLAEGPFLISARPVLTSEEKGPRVGTLVGGRALSEPLVRAFSDLLLVPLTLAKTTPPEPGAPDLALRALDRETVAGDWTVRDLDGRPAAVLSFTMGRAFRAQFLRAWRMLLIGFAMIGTAAFLILLAAFDRQVVRRMSRLSRFVEDVETSGDLSRRVRVGGRDELHELGEATNTLLGTLQEHIERTDRAEAASRAGEAKYRTLFESSPQAVFLESIDGRILDCNRAAERLLGYSRGELQKLSLDAILPEGARADLGDVLPILMEKDRHTFRSVNKAKDGTILPVEITIQGTDIGTEHFFLVYVRDLRAEVKAEAAKTALFEISQAAGGEANLDDLYAMIGRTLAALFPCPNIYIALIDTASGRISFPLFMDEYDARPEGRPLGRGLTEYVFRTGEPLLSSLENTRALNAAGEVEMMGTPAVDWLGVPLRAKGAAIGVLAVQSYSPEVRLGEDEKALLQFLSTQVALAIERVQAHERVQTSLREKEALLREVHHRVKNNMQIISSLFNLQAGVIQDPTALASIRECQARIRSMSLVHEKLYRSADLAQIRFDDYIQNLALRLFHFWGVESSRVRLETDLQPVVLDINTAIPGGLIVNELITNALEHAFPDGRRGTIRVGLRRLESGAFEVSVADDGVGLPQGFDPAAPGTLGMQLVDMLARQLDGTFGHAGGDGTRFTVTFREPSSRPRA